MRCYICDREDSSIGLDHRDGKFEPCRTCQEIISECVLDYDVDESYELDDPYSDYEDTTYDVVQAPVIDYD